MDVKIDGWALPGRSGGGEVMGARADKGLEGDLELRTGRLIVLVDFNVVNIRLLGLGFLAGNGVEKFMEYGFEL